MNGRKTNVSGHLEKYFNIDIYEGVDDKSI